MDRGKKVEEYMSPISDRMVTTETSLMEVVKLLAMHKQGAIIITDDNKEFEGVISGTDLLRQLEKNIESSVLLDGLAKHIMTKKGRAATIGEGTLMVEAVDEMTAARVHSLIVMRVYQPVGILTQGDVLRWWYELQGGVIKPPTKRT